MAKGDKSLTQVSAKVKSIRFFAKTMDAIVEPENLYLELEVPGRASFNAEAGSQVVVINGEGFAAVCAAMTDKIEVAIRKQQRVSVNRDE